MINYFAELHPALQTLIATSFTWAMTALGAAAVFLFKAMSKRLVDAMLGFAAGVMIAASFWSLLLPALELSSDTAMPTWLPALIGFLAGGVFLRALDRVLPHLHLGFPEEEAEGIKTTWKRTTLFILAITLHNIPEGLAVGVAFGAIANGMGATLPTAIALAIGIGLQNFPEGLAVAMPLGGAGLSRAKSFWYGQLSAVVEPIAGVIGALTVIYVRSLMPYALAFAAGAMIFVVVEEVIPESQSNGNTDLATGGAMIGFAVMMVLDVAFS